VKFPEPEAHGGLQRALLFACLLLAPALAGLGLGVGLLCAGASFDGFVTNNRIASSTRSFLVISALVGAVLGVIIAIASVLLGPPRFGERLARMVSLLWVLGVLPLLSNERLFRKSDLQFLIGVWTASALFTVSVRSAVKSSAFSLPSWLRSFSVSEVFRRIALGTAVLGGLSYATYFSSITLASHFNFCTSAFDLGIEDNLLWNAAHGGPLFRSAPLGGNMLHGGNHQTYFTFVLVPLYWLAPRAETLLIIQSVALGLAAVPLYLFAVRLLAPAYALFLALGYLFYAPLHGANLYDFHYQPFGIVFTFLNAYLLLAGRLRWLFLTVPLMLSVREDMGAMLGALGAYFVLSGRRARVGSWLMVLGSAYFVAFKLWIMPQYFMGGESSFTFMYKDLVPPGERGFVAVLKTVLINPLYVLDTLLTKEKLIYLLQIFVPVLFLALRRSPALVLFLPACTFTLLSTGYPALTMTTFQYTSYWTPMVFLSVVEVLSRGGGVPPREAQVARFATVVGVALALLLTSNRYGAIFQTETARGAFDPVRVEITPEDRKNNEDFSALVRQIPPDAKVVAAEWLVSHLSNRKDAYTLRFGVRDAEYLIFWTHRDKLRSDEKPVLKKALLGKDAPFGVMETRGMFVLAKRGHPKDQNDSVRSKL
jgi:uncharacterized membrane protein